jgi:hypothetical protein
MAKQPDESAARAEPAYPYHYWKTAIKVADAVSRSGGDRSPVDRDTLAHELQAEASSPSLAQQIASAKSFNLIEGRGAFRLTPAGKLYFFPTSEQEKRRAELQCFAAPKAFKVLLEKFDGNTLPQASTVGNVLKQHADVGTSWKDRVAAIFLDAAQTLQVVDQGGRLRYSVALAGAATAPPSHTTTGNGHGGSAKTPTPAEIKEVTVSDKLEMRESLAVVVNRQGTNVWAFAEAGGSVRVETPDPLPRELWLRLKRYVEVLEPAEPEKGRTHEST